MFVRKILSNAKVLYCRAMSNSSPLVNLAVGNDGISILTLQRPPINSINLDMLQDMNEALDKIEKSGSTGLIITSVSYSYYDIRPICYKALYKSNNTFLNSVRGDMMCL